MITKEQVIEKLNNNIKDIKALMKDIDAWDIYNDENWVSLINNLKEAKQLIREQITKEQLSQYLDRLDLLNETPRQKYKQIAIEVFGKTRVR
jgi:hypothetical protein